MSLRGLFDHKARVWRASVVRDELAGELEEWEQVGADPDRWNCTCAEPPHRLQDAGAGEALVGTRVINFIGQDVAERDVIQVYDGPESPILVRAVSVAKPRGHHVKCMCEPWNGSLTA